MSKTAMKLSFEKNNTLWAG